MTDYSEVLVPEQTPPEDYSYTERRAEILELMERKGHPHGFNYSQLGRRYGVSDVQIRKDFATLKEYHRENLGSDAKTTSELAYNRIIQGHLDNGDLEKARKALDSWNDWLFDIGAQEKSPEKLDVDQTTTHELGDDERAVYTDFIKHRQQEASDE